MKKVLGVMLFVMFVSSVAFAAANTGSGTANKSANKTTSSSTSSSSKAPVKATVADEANGGMMAVGYSLTGAMQGEINNLAFRFSMMDFAAEALLGFNLGGDRGNVWALGFKAFYNLKKYSNFNVYATAGLGLDIYSKKAGDTTAFKLLFGAGTEYFLAKNLSVSMEVGMAGYWAKDFDSFGTYGDWMSNLGFRYYL